MDLGLTLVTTLAVGFGLALILGYLAERMKAPPLVGYLLAGILIGPATPGFVADAHMASQLSEIGVMLLMFGVGLVGLSDRLASPRPWRPSPTPVLLGHGTADTVFPMPKGRRPPPLWQRPACRSKFSRSREGARATGGWCFGGGTVSG